MSTAPALATGAPRISLAAPTRQRYFFHPLVDFLCLGGGSIVLVLLIAALGYGDETRAKVVAVSVALAHVINHPHFAHSYQIFYRNYLNKVSAAPSAAALRARYLVAGLLVPALLIGFFSITIAAGDVVLLGQAANLMGLLVGWHYVKQGYGVLIAVSVLQRQFFTDVEKRVALINAYACWISFWLATNWLVNQRNLFGIKHLTFDIPQGVLIASLVISALTTCALAAVLVRKWRASGTLPYNGIMAYATTLYLWLFGLTDPLLVFVVPASHSLQYLLIVWRYRLNLEEDLDRRAAPGDPQRPKPYSSSRRFRFMVFIAVGTLLGYLGFWMIPGYLDQFAAYDREIFGPALFMFSFWVFINVHHYFIDNVIWRRENPDTKKYLFGSG